MKKIIILAIIIAIICLIGVVLLNMAKTMDAKNTKNDSLTRSGDVEITNQDEQIKVIADNVEKWSEVLEFANDTVEYMVTDLDHNGRMELVITQMGGSGTFSYNSVYEVSKDFKTLELCQNNVEEGESEADFSLSNSAEVYYDAGREQYFYVLTDHMKTNPNEYYDGLYAFSLKDGKVQEDYIASKITFYDYDNNNQETVMYSDHSSDNIEEFDYFNAVENYFSGCEFSTIKFNWKDAQGINDLPEEELINTLNESISL